MALYAGIELPNRPDPLNIMKLDLLPIPMVRSMNRYGMRIDPEHFRDLSFRLQTRKTILRKDITSQIPPQDLDRFIELAGMDDPTDYDDDGMEVMPEDQQLNVDSGKKIAELLYDVLGLHKSGSVKVKKTKGGSTLSTGKKTLEQLKRDHPVVQLILDYRESSKLDGTYAKTMPRHARFHPKGKDCPLCGWDHREDELRVHAQILTTRTSTGRTAHKNPNLANIPTRSKLGRDIRAGFVASTGCLIADEDLSGIELRLLADQSGDEVMCGVFLDDGDIHSMTACSAFGLRPEELDPLTHRIPAKTCIAGGQKVLTDTGLVAIEDVSCHHKVWDGTNFVSHGGVIFQGFKKVMTYAGLTATPDHIVWTPIGKMSFKDARESRLELSVSESKGCPVRITEDYVSSSPLYGVKVHCSVGGVCGMRKGPGGFDFQYPWWENEELYLQEDLRRREIHTDYRSLAGHTPAVQQPKLRVLPKLRSAWGRVSVWVSERISGLYSDRTPASELPQGGCRQEGQRRPLRTGESSTGNKKQESSQSPNQCSMQLSGVGDHPGRSLRTPVCGLPGLQTQQDTDSPTGIITDSVAGDIGTNSTEALEKAAPVYDILNCGPNHRFTVSGVLVSNCNFSVVYGTTEMGLFDQLCGSFGSMGMKQPDWLTEQWCKWFIEKWFATYAGAKIYLGDLEAQCRAHAISWTPCGRVRRIPEVRSVHRWIQEAGVRQAGNMPIQGYSADIMKLIMGEVWERLCRLDHEYGIKTRPLNTIYDALMIEAEEDDAEAVRCMIGEVMSQVLVDKQTGKSHCKVPVKSEGHCSRRWEK